MQETSVEAMVGVIEKTKGMFRGGGWEQRKLAQAEDGTSVAVESSLAVRFCMAAGLQRASGHVPGSGQPCGGGRDRGRVRETVIGVSGGKHNTLGPWNDVKGREVGEVIEVLEITKRGLLERKGWR